MIYFDFESEPSRTLNDHVHSCSDKVPADGNFEGYSGIKNCTCAFCDEACEKPAVNSDISFFDGFDGELVGIVYGCLIVFSIVFQYGKHKYVQRKLKEYGH